MNAAHYGLQGEYRNPYDFVPLEGTPTPAPAIPHDRARGVSGEIEIGIETLTPLCIHQNPSRPNRRDEYEFSRLDGQPIVPATSLKGMLRAIHEIVTNSSMGLLKSEARGGWYRRRIPRGYVPVEGQLTPSESLFGIVDQGDDSVGYAGRLLIEDTPVTVPTTIERVARPRGGMPKPEHESFYFVSPGQGRILGRKLYYHQQDYRAVMAFYEHRRGRATEMRALEVVPAEQQLTGCIRFLNLSLSELEDLVYTIVLEDRLAHKLGYGKPLGLGSVRLHIVKLEVETEEDGIPARFLNYGPPPRHNRTCEVAALRDAALARWQVREHGPLSYAAFVAIARWPQDELFIYPDYGFFAAERGRPEKTTLQQRQQRDTLYPYTNAPFAPSPPDVPTGPHLVGQLMTKTGQGAGVLYEGYFYRIDMVTLSNTLKKQLKRGDEPTVRFVAGRGFIENKEVDLALDVQPYKEEL